MEFNTSGQTKAVGSLKISCTFWIIIILYSGERIDQALASAGKAISNSSTERNKAIVLEAFDAMFNKSDYVAAERFRSQIQRSVEALRRVQAYLNRYFEEEVAAA